MYSDIEWNNGIKKISYGPPSYKQPWPKFSNILVFLSPKIEIVNLTFFSEQQGSFPCFSVRRGRGVVL